MSVEQSKEMNPHKQQRNMGQPAKKTTKKKKK